MKPTTSIWHAAGVCQGLSKNYTQKKEWAWPCVGGAPQNLGVLFNIYTMAEASVFKVGTQLKITPIGKSGHGFVLAELPKILRFYFNIYTMAEATDFKFGTQLGFAKARHKTTPEEKWSWPWAREAPIYLGFPVNISAAAACPLSVSGASYYSMHRRLTS